MFVALIASLAIVLAQDAVPVKVSVPPANAGVAAPSAVTPADDPEAEHQLLEMANQARAKAGLPPLRIDEGLTQAARQHAAALAAEQELSHQLPGELPLARRLASSTNLHLDRGGENVASAPSVDQVHESLMLSPAHRENLLNAAYNVAGFGVVRRGYTLYVTQDFGQGAPAYSRQDSEDRLAISLGDLRAGRHLPPLQRVESSAAQLAACSMAKTDSLSTPASREMAQSHYLLRYTSPQPQLLPSNAAKVVGSRDIRAFAAGSCYARTASYPSGVYWIVLMFY